MVYIWRIIERDVMTNEEYKEFLEIFDNELKQIKDQEFRKLVEAIIKQCPFYLATIPSSSTGKYHPQDEINEKGMIYHVKRLLVFVDEIVRMEQLDKLEREGIDAHKPTDPQDILIAGAILHDIFKNGAKGKDLKPISKYTHKQHPIFIFKLINDFIEVCEGVDNRNAPMLVSLAHVCLFHEGQWTVPESKVEFKKTGRKMSEYDKKLCKAMHMADYFASRRSVYEIMQDMRK